MLYWIDFNIIFYWLFASFTPWQLIALANSQSGESTAVAHSNRSGIVNNNSSSGSVSETGTGSILKAEASETSGSRIFVPVTQLPKKKRGSSHQAAAEVKGKNVVLIQPNDNNTREALSHEGSDQVGARLFITLNISISYFLFYLSFFTFIVDSHFTKS